jgi:ABC-type phosphate transport system auxiliary subunit
MIHEEIRNLLEAPPTGENAPSLDHIEHTLTAGYARALALEAERWRLERKIAQIVAKLGADASQQRATELAQLGKRLSSADVDLTQLRGLLSSLRTRADEARTLPGH